MNKTTRFWSSVVVMNIICIFGQAHAMLSTLKTDDTSPSIIAQVINLDGKSLSVTFANIREPVAIIRDFTPDGYTKGELTRDQVKQLAKKSGLLSETETNPHLSFLEGDISYWVEQKLSLKRYRMEFAARKAVLDAADKAKIVIEDQGKLSWAAQQIIAKTLKEMNTPQPPKSLDQK